MKRFLNILLAALLVISALSVTISAADVAFIGYNAGNNANDGLTAQTAKKSLGTTDGSGAISLVKNGGILVVSEKMYIGDNYTWKTNGKVTVTANYGGQDYKKPSPADNPASGIIKIKPACTLTVASDLTLSDILYFQEGKTNVIHVTGGATLTVEENVVFTSKSGHYPQILVDSGSTAILNGGKYDSVSGAGNIQMGAKASIATPTVSQMPIVYVAHTGGNNANDGLSDTSPKQSFGTSEGTGVAGALKKGGTIIVSGKAYIGSDYAWCVNGDTTITAVYGGKDYKNTSPVANPASGVLKMKPGATLTIASNVTLDDIILFQENAQCTILVSGGATLTINESVITMSNREHYMKIFVAEGSTAIINGGTFSSVSGTGTIKIGEKATILEKTSSDTAQETDTAKREMTVCYLDYDNGNNANDGKSAQNAVKSYGTGIFKRILIGGTVVVSGNSYIGGTNAANEYAMPLLVKPLTFTSVYNGIDYTDNAEFRFAKDTTLVIANDVIFDNIVLVQGEGQNTIRVKSGATLTITDTAKLVTTAETKKHYNIVVEKGAMAILSAEAQKMCTVTGEGTVLPYTDGYTELFKQHIGTSTIVELTIGSKTAYINGKVQAMDTAPINRKNRTMLPVRFLANAFGIDDKGIEWIPATRTAILKNADVTIEITIDAPAMTVNGNKVALDSLAIIESNRTYLPVRAIANALGVSNNNIVWEASTNTATLIK